MVEWLAWSITVNEWVMSTGKSVINGVLWWSTLGPNLFHFLSSDLEAAIDFVDHVG